MSDGHRSGRSTGRVSCKSTELKRCSMIEIRWNKYEVSLASPILIIIVIDIIIICQLNSHCPTQRNLAVSTAFIKLHCCAQFIAKPKAARALRFSWAATSSNLVLWANMASSILPEVHNVSLRRQSRTEPRPRETRSDQSSVGAVRETVYRRRPGLPSHRTHHLQQPAGQRDICPVSVNLPSAFKNISVPGLVPWHYHWSRQIISHLQWILKWFY